MIKIETSRTLRYLTDALNQKHVKKDDIVSFFQNKEGNYVVMYESKMLSNGADSQREN